MRGPFIPVLGALVVAIGTVACVPDPAVDVGTTEVAGPRPLGVLTVVESDEPCLGTRCILFVVTCADVGEGKGHCGRDSPASAPISKK